MTVAQSTLTVPTTGSVTITVPASVSALLRTGSYLLTTTAADLTVAAQPIELGSGRPPSGFRRVWFGDLQGTYPANAGVFVGPSGADYLDAADAAAAHLERARRLGWTLVVDRLPDQQSGLALLDPTDGSYDLDPSGTAVATTANRLVADSRAFNAISLWDDPAHPESWLRDTRLDIRTSPAAPWQPVTRLVSDQPSRSHTVADPARPGQPVTATQLRLVLPPGIAGNIRLAAIALHLTS